MKPYDCHYNFARLTGIDFNLEHLWASIPWERREDSPRNECWFATDGRSYTYGRGRGIRTYESNIKDFDSIPDWLYSIWTSVELGTGFHFEGCFINGYQDGSDHLGWHDDDGPDLDHKKPIAVVSFGATREIWIRANINSSVAPQIDKIKLENGSLFIMNPGMQKTYQHRIPKTGNICGPRISFTFRGLNSK